MHGTALKRNAAGLTAIVAVIAAATFASEPRLSSKEEAELAARFRFTHVSWPQVLPEHVRSIREVNPNLRHIAGWISTVGSAIAINDLDGDGLPNDLCLVEPRVDQIIVSPVPGTAARYSPLTLSPQPLPYDAATMAPMGCLPADLNEDGQMDLVAYYWGRTPVLFMRHEGGYHPIELTAVGERWYTNAASFADLDGDGHADLVFANYFQDGARILDANAQVPDEMQHSMSRAYNGGQTHFFLWESASSGGAPQVRFREVHDVLEPTHGAAWTLALGAADLDDDGLPELYFANDFGPDRLLHNRSKPNELKFAAATGKRGFTTPRSKVVGVDSFKGMGVDFADLNGDGMLDLCVSNIAAPYALEESHFVFVSTGPRGLLKEGIAPYIDRSESLGMSRSNWGWDCRFADFDNDGLHEMVQATGFLKGTVDRWPELQELAMGNDELLPKSQVWFRAQQGDDLSGDAANVFYVRARDGRYYDVASALGLDDRSTSRGIATADVDGDGDMDLAVANQWAPSRFYRNDCDRCNGYLTLHLRLPTAGDPRPFEVTRGPPGGLSRPAIGASVVLLMPDGRRRVAQVDSGSGHSGKRSPEIHFGLDKVAPDALLEVQIRWRDVDGALQHRTVMVNPGAHTVLLAKDREALQAGGR